MRAGRRPPSACSISGWRPTSSSRASGRWAAKESAAGTVTDTPWSPPMQSMAIPTVTAAPDEPRAPRATALRKSIDARDAGCLAADRQGLESGARRGLFVALGLNDFLAAIEAGRADVMTAMNFAGGRFDRSRRIRQEIVRAMRAPLRRRLLVLLDSHGQPHGRKQKLYPSLDFGETPRLGAIICCATFQRGEDSEGAGTFRGRFDPVLLAIDRAAVFVAGHQR